MPSTNEYTPLGAIFTQALVISLPVLLALAFASKWLTTQQHEKAALQSQIAQAQTLAGIEAIRQKLEHSAQMLAAKKIKKTISQEELIQLLNFPYPHYGLAIYWQTEETKNTLIASPFPIPAQTSYKEKELITIAKNGDTTSDIYTNGKHIFITATSRVQKTPTAILCLQLIVTPQLLTSIAPQKAEVSLLWKLPSPNVITTVHSTEKQRQHWPPAPFLPEGTSTKTFQETINGTPYSATYSRVLNTRNHPVCYLAVSVPANTPSFLIIWAGLAIAGITLCTALLYARQSMRKRTEEWQLIENAMHGITSGNLTTPLSTAHSSTLAHVFATFTTMRQSLITQFAELRNALSTYKTIYENMMEGLFVTSLDGRLLEANPALLLILGFENLEEARVALSDLENQIYVLPEDRTEFIRKLREKGQVKEFETQLYRKDGSIIWAGLTARIITLPTENSPCFEGSVVDITERRIRHKEELATHDKETAARATARCLAALGEDLYPPLHDLLTELRPHLTNNDACPAHGSLCFLQTLTHGMRYLRSEAANVTNQESACLLIEILQDAIQQSTMQGCHATIHLDVATEIPDCIWCEPRSLTACFASLLSICCYRAQEDNMLLTVSTMPTPLSEPISQFAQTAELLFSIIPTKDPLSQNARSPLPRPTSLETFITTALVQSTKGKVLGDSSYATSLLSITIPFKIATIAENIQQHEESFFTFPKTPLPPVTIFSEMEGRIHLLQHAIIARKKENALQMLPQLSSLLTTMNIVKDLNPLENLLLAQKWPEAKETLDRLFPK